MIDASEHLARLVERHRKGIFDETDFDVAEFLRFNGVRVGVFENFRKNRLRVERFRRAEINRFGRRREPLLERFAGFRVFQRFEGKRLARESEVGVVEELRRRKLERRVREKFERGGAFFKRAETLRTDYLNGISVRLQKFRRKIVFRSERGELVGRKGADFGRKLREGRGVADLLDRGLGGFRFRRRFLTADERGDAQKKSAGSDERRPTR